MIWSAIVLIVICPVIYCQSNNHTTEDLQKQSKPLFIIPTTVPSVVQSSENTEKFSKRHSIDRLPFNSDVEGEEGSTDDFLASESSVNVIKDDINTKDVAAESKPSEPESEDLKAILEFNNRSSFESVLNEKSENEFQSKQLGNSSSGSDQTKTQSKVVLSQAINPSSSSITKAQRQENELLSKRIDGLLPFNGGSYREIGKLDSDVSPDLESFERLSNQLGSKLALKSEFQNQRQYPKSDFDGNIDSNIQSSFYPPSEDDRKLFSGERNFSGKEKSESGISAKPYTGTRSEGKNGNDGHYDSDYPEVTRKVTVVHQKTMRSMSRTEEQESINVPEKPEGRFANGDGIILKTQPSANILSHPKTRTKEETIILVEGSHIPGKNYGPEDDLFGYHFNAYKDDPKQQNDQFKGSSDINSGDAPINSHIQHSNHGNGVSTQFYVGNHPSTSKGSKLKSTEPEDNYYHEIAGNIAPIGNDAHVKCPHNVDDSDGDNLGVKHGEIDPNQLYIDAKTGELIKFVTEGDPEANFQHPSSEEVNKLLEDSQGWSQQEHFDDSVDSKEGLNLQNFGNVHSNNFDAKRKFKTRSTSKIPDLPNPETLTHSLFNKPSKENHFKQPDINTKEFRFEGSLKGINLETDPSLGAFPGTHVSQNDFKDDGNFKGIANVPTNNGVLCPQHHSSVSGDDGNYGQKLNLGNIDYSPPNVKGGPEHDLKNIIGSLPENYGEKNGNSFHEILNQPANEHFNDQNFETKLIDGNYKGSNQDYKGSNQGQPKLFNKPKNKPPTYNGLPYKNVYFEFPTKQTNQNFNAPKLNSGSYANFHTGNKKGTVNNNYGNDNDNHNILDCIKSHNHFKYQNIGIPQNNNKGSPMDIRKHPNYMVSLQNLFGFKAPGFSQNKGSSNNKNNRIPKHQTNGYPKGDLTYLPEIPLSQKNYKPYYHRQYNTKSEVSPNSAHKGFNFQNAGKGDQHLGYELPKNGKYDDSSYNLDASIGEHGKYNSHKNLPMHIPNFQQQQHSEEFGNKFDTINVHQQPGEYILVEIDDNNKDSDLEHYYNLYNNNFNGEQVDLNHLNGKSGRSFAANGNTVKHPQSRNVRYVYNGGRDITFPLRRLASTGYHMARAVIPLMEHSRHNSVHGNVLQFNKRKGLVEDFEDSVKA
ncbi:hypothetical protein JTE90_013287 [Oedothorax gibbosus]|uniref:Uncharacterized protein n=1 Tax=Oedothorax gibbosus TaxID=931172 RepID=A0AAV6VD09_9ARAC|nr:hypothetical protein JTE90_013287 [Oedothorax gibbosus]